jgi:hypothetical protein
MMTRETVSVFGDAVNGQETPEIHELRHGNALEAIECIDNTHKFAQRLEFLEAARALAQDDKISDTHVLDALSAFAIKTGNLLLRDKTWPPKENFSQFIRHLVAFAGEQPTEPLRDLLVSRQKQMNAVAQYGAHELH